MAFFTAVNIDGSTWTNIDRKSGEPKEGEASEVWYEDPRIDIERAVGAGPLCRSAAQAGL